MTASSVTSSRGFVADPAARYEMPVVFGPTLVPQVSKWGWFQTLDVMFATTAEAIRPVVPAILDIPTEPVVTVSRRTFRDVDYLAGRGYEELCIGVSASHDDGTGERRGTFWFAMWVDKVAPITLGREATGFAKLGAEFPVSVPDSGGSFEVLEYGTRLVTGSVLDVTALDQARLDALNRRAGSTFGYNVRYIPPVSGGAGINQVTRCEMATTLTSVGSGVGAVEFEATAWSEAPQSGRIFMFLRSLPVLEMRPGFILEGHSSFDRSTVTAIGSMAGPH